MTFVSHRENTTTGTGVAASPAAPPPEKWAAVAPTGVTPVTGPSLSHRLDWERRYSTRVTVTDVAIVLFATSLAFGAQAFVRAPAYGEPAGTGTSVLTLVITVAVWVVALAALRTRAANIRGAGSTEYQRVMHATVLTFGLLALMLLAFQIEGQKFQIFVAMPVGIIGLLVGRNHWRRWLMRKRQYGHYRSRAIVIGKRADVDYVLDRIQDDPASSFLVVGAALYDGGADAAPVGSGTRVAVLGDAHEAARLAAEASADTIVVANTPDDDPNFIRHLSWELEGTAAELVLSSRLTDVAGPRISFRPVTGLPLIHVRIPAFEGGQYLLKRALDITVGTVGMVFVALMTPIIGLLIKIDSRGPVFFMQERVGRDGKTFRMLKFRTMHTRAEEMLQELQNDDDARGPLFKMKSDPRVTRVGRFLRKHSLDEFPQFWNVLRGHMSAVGPRPPLPTEVMTYDGTVYRRLYIKPGVTGLWQVSGRSDLSWEESVRLDLYYVGNWSVMKDLMIMWQTVRHVLRPHGAY